jgi:hypothetical protein
MPEITNFLTRISNASMMRSHMHFFCALSIALLTVIGCADLLGAESPSEVVKAVYTAANEGDTAEVERHLSAPDPAAVEVIGIIASDGRQQKWRPSLEPGSLQSIEILDEDKTTYRATVSFRLNFTDGRQKEMRLQLMKEAGYWKILR